MKLLTSICFTLLSVFFIQSCKPACERHPEDPDCAGENELITTLRVIVSDSATHAVIDTFQFVDMDGNGSPELFDTIQMEANRAYRVNLQFLNESVNPVENITSQIELEKNDHFIAYHVHDVTIHFTYLDFDDHNPPLPLGLQTYWHTGSAASGHVHVILRHQPGVKNGTETPGATDVSVEFPVKIQ